MSYYQVFAVTQSAHTTLHSGVFTVVGLWTQRRFPAAYSLNTVKEVLEHVGQLHAGAQALWLPQQTQTAISAVFYAIRYMSSELRDTSPFKARTA